MFFLFNQERETWGRLKEEFIENSLEETNDPINDKTVSQILLEFVKLLDEIKSGLEERLSLQVILIVDL